MLPHQFGSLYAIMIKHTCRNSTYNTSAFYIMSDNSIGTNKNVGANCAFAQDLASRSQHTIITDRSNTFIFSTNF